jgi:hypothetical protein
LSSIGSANRDRRHHQGARWRAGDGVAVDCRRQELGADVVQSAEQHRICAWAWPDGPRGYLKAIDPLTGMAKWEAPSDIPRFSGVLSTGGGVVFSGRGTPPLYALVCAR